MNSYPVIIEQDNNGYEERNRFAMVTVTISPWDKKPAGFLPAKNKKVRCF